jgi:hypothetical protein
MVQIFAHKTVCALVVRQAMAQMAGPARLDGPGERRGRKPRASSNVPQ